LAASAVMPLIASPHTVDEPAPTEGPLPVEEDAVEEVIDAAVQDEDKTAEIPAAEKGAEPHVLNSHASESADEDVRKAS
ncbi:MAG: hypothetical protein AAGJ56_11045, partial [Myxococcota bacterium]